MTTESYRGDPGYLEGREDVENRRILIMFHWVETPMLKKKIYDLSRLREVPEASMKVLRMELRT